MMNIKTACKTVLTVLIFASLLFIGNAYATQFVSTGAYNFQKGEVLDDDLIMTGESAKIAGDIQGNLIAASRSVVINGNILGSLFSASQFVKVFGNLNGSMTSFCQQAQLNGQVQRNILVFGESFNFGPEGRVGYDINFYGSEAIIEGRVGGNLDITANEIIISGTIDSDVNLKSENITLRPSAVIKGNFNYEANRPAKIEEGATVIGATNWTQIDHAEDKEKDSIKWVGSITTISVITLIIAMVIQFFGLLIAAFTGSGFLGTILFGCSVIIAMLLLILVSKKEAVDITRLIFKSPLLSVLMGLLIFVVIPVAAVFFAITIIGLPIALLLTFLFGLLTIAGWLYCTLAVGELVVRKVFSKKESSLFLSMLIGTVIMIVLAGIPYLGGLIAFVTTFAGIGALVLRHSKFKNETLE
ncbi:MAG: hypothetical protein GF307_11790 [candidate division Zixibacteria bacterium]|nr:hypothetical protein [candidate division Zixibacteria bacterium]